MCAWSAIVPNAQKVAEFLERHPQVAWVTYAGLESSPYRKLARKYLPRGAGAVFTFGVRGGYDAGVKLVENVGLFSHLANIGDTRSLILHPASTTHRQLTDEQRLAAGAGPDVIRLSIGLETAEDLIADLDQALEAAGALTVIATTTGIAAGASVTVIGVQPAASPSAWAGNGLVADEVDLPRPHVPHAGRAAQQVERQCGAVQQARRLPE